MNKMQVRLKFSKVNVSSVRILILRAGSIPILELLLSGESIKAKADFNYQAHYNKKIIVIENATKHIRDMIFCEKKSIFLTINLVEMH